MHLYVVPTPIGNLADMSFRAVTALKEAKLILAEDTRTTGVLLKHYGIETKMLPHHKFNEHKMLERTAALIKEHGTVALVSDAGTPAISDPGFLLIRHCIDTGIKVECLPGATAFVPALVNSGLPSERFCFEGFLPQKKGRQKKLAELQAETRTIIFYESPHRLTKLLEHISLCWGDRLVSVSRELTKLYEENFRGRASEALAHFTAKEIKGEIVLVVQGAEEQKLPKQNKYSRDSEEGEH
jgi:16S rRNA (cytidine1402-2'-O)-methyltransferase